MIRRAEASDFPLISRAQQACRYELEAVSDEELRAALEAGALEGYILEAGSRTVFIAVVASGVGAMLSCFYREGSPIGLRGDARRLLMHVSNALRPRGVTRLFLCLSDDNPDKVRLMRLYESLYFGRDMVRMSRGILPEGFDWK